MPPSRLPQFGLKSLLAFLTAVAVVMAPFHWFGGAYLVSAAFSTGLIISCVLAYRSQHPASSLAVAGGGAALGILVAIGLLIYSMHAVLNLIVCGVLLSAKVRPRTFGLGLIAVAVAIYGHSFWMGTAKMRELTALKQRFPFESLEERLSFERKLQPARSEIESSAPLSLAVSANLDELESQWNDRYLRRAWALRRLHEETNSLFARAAGFGFMRMPTVSEQLLSLVPRSLVKVPLAIGLSELNPAGAELFGKHRAAVLDFVDADRMGYLRNREAVAGFEPHGFSSLPDQLSDGDPDAHWQISRLELVSLLRHDEPRVYISATLPLMDQLADVPHRPLNEFERSSLQQLASQTDAVFDLQPEQIQMLGAIRAGTKCLECHEGQRGQLLGAFSYDIVPLASSE